MYIKKFLNQTFLNEDLSIEKIKKRKYFCYQLYLSIKNQLNVLESGLTVHNRVIKQLSNSLINMNNNRKNFDNIVNNQEAQATATTVSNETNIDHMKQLNKHLISCLNLLKNELDDFYVF